MPNYGNVYMQALMNVFYLGKNVKEAVDAPRLHHQLFPMNLFYEDGTTTVQYAIQ